MFTMNDWAQIALIIFRLVLAVLTAVSGCIIIPWLRREGIPWLKEHRLYGLVSKFVFAAEKTYQNAENAGEDKYKYVIECLTNKGIEITNEVRDYIESAVEELDLFTLEALGGLADLFIEDYDEEEEDEQEADETEISED